MDPPPAALKSILRDDRCCPGCRWCWMLKQSGVLAYWQCLQNVTFIVCDVLRFISRFPFYRSYETACDFFSADNVDNAGNHRRRSGQCWSDRKPQTRRHSGDVRRLRASDRGGTEAGTSHETSDGAATSTKHDGAVPTSDLASEAAWV